MSITSSLNVTLTDINIQHFSKLPLKIVSSSISLMDRIQIRNCSQALDIRSSTITNMTNSTLTGNGGINLAFGGAMKISDSSILVENSSLTQNTAHSGGAIYFTCSSMTL